MTTAGRPTFESARGGAHQGARLYVPSQKYSKLDLPGHLVLKERHVDPDAPAEPDVHALTARLLAEDDAVPRALPPPAPLAVKDREDEDKEEESGGGTVGGTKRPAPSLDADDSDDDDDEDDDNNKNSDDDDDEDDDEDETEALLAELERIKQERQAEQAREKEAEAARVKAEAVEDAATSNPLLAGLVPGTASAPPSAVMRKKWYEETVFKNQSRGEPEQRKRFINDTVRNDFHLRFLHRYFK